MNEAQLHDLENLTVVVFAGAHYGNNPDHQYVAYEMGKLIAEAGYELANGAGDGLMEEVSKGAKEAGGKVFGVGLKGFTPNQYLDVYHERVGIHSRQSYLFSKGDAFICLPGGMGTLYEIMEISELKKLAEVEPEPVIIINHEGFYDDYKHQLERMRSTGFIPNSIEQFVEFVSTPAEAMEVINNFYKKWEQQTKTESANNSTT
ncbi:TIGR00730 family Rossman fold protein [Candidatus Dojkabacteria bacterium]|uniref:Cytokinin riboside 5'-monophosphate phosphoribohydrolase n=1 Tax=Candidatus Dojkabacteria bacterium TaxID=2099670 RepID=A0A955RK54_9BACT|nr:TIGR00730 family Rossman fold protein [Candidatus Dojkabacteria bacterium]